MSASMDVSGIFISIWLAYDKYIIHNMWIRIVNENSMYVGHKSQTSRLYKYK